MPTNRPSSSTPRPRGRGGEQLRAEVGDDHREDDHQAAHRRRPTLGVVRRSDRRRGSAGRTPCGSGSRSPSGCRAGSRPDRARPRAGSLSSAPSVPVLRGVARHQRGRHPSRPAARDAFTSTTSPGRNAPRTAPAASLGHVHRLLLPGAVGSRSEVHRAAASPTTTSRPIPSATTAGRAPRARLARVTELAHLSQHGDGPAPCHAGPRSRPALRAPRACCRGWRCRRR